MTSHATRELGSFVAETRFEDIPEEVRKAGIRYIVDAIGCAFAGFRTSEAVAASDVAHASGGAAEASTLNRSDRIPASMAAFANTVAGRVDLYDDSYGVGHIHAGAALTFASLAMTERAGGSARDALRAFLVGGEISARVSRSVGEGHYLAGFHNSGTCVVFGTGAVAAAALGLDVDASQAAISLSGEQAAGLRQYQLDGAPANSALHAANAARNGIFSALLAERGFPAPAAMLEGDRGFLHAFAPKGDASQLTEDLSFVWRIAQTGIKAFPGCRGTHAAAAAIDDFVVEDGLSADDIAAITIYQKPLEVDLCSRPHPDNYLDAHFSTQYAVARVLVRRSINPWEYEPEHLSDREVDKVQSLVEIHAEESLEAYPDACARVEVEVRDGRRLERFVPTPRGEPKNPLSEEQLRRKFVSASSATIDECRANRILDACSGLDSSELPVSAITDLLRVG